ncbi:hypothetical protein V0R37_15210 [Pollutimonas sp. H1-120]|uniref:hypothetical protein n=1 Tax=Pollutimonas sp. H1-120 TaxID=3148824 RepID=UPI003B52EC31
MATTTITPRASGMVRGIDAETDFTQCLKARSARIITGTRDDTTIHLEHLQYRELAAMCKVHAGKPLNLASVRDMEGDWGRINYWALPVLDDVTQAEQQYREQAYIFLVNRLKTGAVRAAGVRRPECDWSQLKNSEIYQFIVWHEIGHVRDNFHPMQFLFRQDLPPEAVQASRKAAYINEVLADRYAWERVRPGQSMPLTEQGKRDADQIERDIDELSRYFTRDKFPHTPLEADQYRSVPAYMLSSKRKAAYVGPDINPELLKREIDYYRAASERRGGRMSGVTL